MALNTIPPKPPEEVVEDKTNTVTEPVITQPGATAVTPPTEPPKAEPPKVDTFLESLNKDFGTTYKTRDEFKSVLGLPTKITEYETKLKDSEKLAKDIEDYKKKITELEESQDPLKYFSSPDAYKAEQLRIKYPKSNPYLLQEIAMTDVNKMGDLDVLVKDKLLFVPNAPKEEVIRKIILRDYGIDSTVPPEEWDELSVGKMTLDAAAARDKINNLKGMIEMPKQPLTREQREKEESEALAKKEQAIVPLKEDYGKFDKFSHEGIEGFDMDVPNEYKSKLPDMFQSMFIDAGLEPTPENLQTAIELRDALFVLEYLPKLRDIWLKEGRTEAEKKKDEELHNTQPPNTATASDQQPVNPFAGKGLDRFLQDQKSK